MVNSMLETLKRVCKFHRSKDYYIANRTSEYYIPLERASCWCLLTQGAVGPDDKFVSAGGCNPSRSCFRSQIPE